MPARSSRSMNAPVTRSGQRRASRGRSRSACRGSARSAAGSSPSRCRPRARACAAAPRRRTRPRGRPANAARSGGVTWVSLANAAMSKTSSSCGAMFQSPTSAVVLAEPVAGGVAQPGRASRACRRSAGRRPCGRWARRATTSGRRRRSRRSPAPPPRPGRRTRASRRSRSATSSMPDPADDRDAVPLVVADRRDLVAQRLQPHQRQLVLAGLGLLQGEHVDVVALAGTPRRGRSGCGGS